MDKIAQAQEILRALGLPKPQQNEMSALTLLALAETAKALCATFPMLANRSRLYGRGICRRARAAQGLR